VTLVLQYLCAPGARGANGLHVTLVLQYLRARRGAGRANRNPGARPKGRVFALSAFPHPCVGRSKGPKGRRSVRRRGKKNQSPAKSQSRSPAKAHKPKAKEKSNRRIAKVKAKKVQEQDKHKGPRRSSRLQSVQVQKAMKVEGARQAKQKADEEDDDDSADWHEDPGSDFGDSEAGDEDLLDSDDEGTVSEASE